VIWQANRRCILQFNTVIIVFTLLDAFEEPTQALQGDGVTLSSAIPALIGVDLSNCNTQLPSLRCNLQKYLNNKFRELTNRPDYVVSTNHDCRYKLVPFPEREGDMLDSEESDENVDDNDDAASSSSRLESGTLQPIDRTQARRLLLQMG